MAKAKRESAARKARKRQEAAAPSRRWLLVPLCYLLAVLVYFGICAVSYFSASSRIKGGSMPSRTLHLEDFILESVIQLEDENGRQRFVSTDGDPKLVYSPAQPFYAGRFIFDAASNRPGGEIVLYYITQPGQPFSENNKLWAQQADDGSWYFDLGGREVAALRLDSDTEGGVVWTVNRLALEAEKPLSAYFAPSAQQVMLLLILPGFAAALGLGIVGVAEHGRRQWRRYHQYLQEHGRKDS